jgi:uncharacterized protein YabN with tetrapyrrole methylase and pyrophosphatase domain
MRAHKIGEKGAKIGFDFDDPYDALAKVKEEVAESRKRLNTKQRENKRGIATFCSRWSMWRG